jgi:hypothetical protein
MSHKHHHPHYPKTLTSYIGLPGEYGTLDVIAESAHTVRFQLTDQSVDLNRADAQEMIRVLAAWLAAPVSRVVIDGDGRETVVMVDGEVRSTDVEVVDDDRVERSHVQGTANRPT